VSARLSAAALVGCAAFFASFGMSAAWAQFDSVPSERGIRLDKQLKQRYQVGVIVRAQGGPVRGLFGTVPVPTDWPEQEVRIVDEEITRNVQRVTYRTLEGGVKQMLFTIPILQNGETAKALVTFEVLRSSTLAPADTSVFVLPAKPERDVLKFLGPSPYIESRDAKIRALARELLAGKENEPAWSQVETMYDWVREHVEYRNGKLKGALAALRDGNGDCEELTSLFIALCRANNIPARTVWVPDHCYPEFYLQDKEGKSHWIPCQAAGTRDFGGMPDHRPILQKGDNFKVPEKSEPQRYVAEFLRGSASAPGAQPVVEFVRRPLAAE
jgi:hypothetical protein